MMKTIIVLLLLLIACSVPKSEERLPFPVLTIAEDEWVNYEGRWLTKGGILRLELSLNAGAYGVDSYYKLHESFESDSVAHGTASHGQYSTYYETNTKQFKICLHDLSEYPHNTHWRYKRPNLSEEMFFTTRGNDELLPCDENYEPITTDRHYTLHKRSKLFTVEGYMSFESDSAIFFERNTRERWYLSDLGEFGELKSTYKKLAKEEFEGVYLKALAYSVLDTASSKRETSLVVKRIFKMGNDPD
jgi:hypothetical protein